MSNLSTTRRLSVLLVAGLLALLVTACTATESAPALEDDVAGEVQSAGEDDHHAIDDHHEDDHHADDAVMPAEDHHASDGHHDEDGGHTDMHDVAGSAPIDGAREIHVRATEFGFEPAVLELEAGEEVNIVLENVGVIEHEVQIEELGFHVHVDVGETGVGGLVVPKAGTYEFGCFVPGHYEAGMRGEVVVQ